MMLRCYDTGYVMMEYKIPAQNAASMEVGQAVRAAASKEAVNPSQSVSWSGGFGATELGVLERISSGVQHA
jgi:hypothetical protein